jgi:SRSO17 transposase
MRGRRNYSEIAQEAGVGMQKLQHFMSHSPWSAERVMDQVQAEVAQRADFVEGGMLLLDDSAVEVSGPVKAGAKRQWNGRLGKVELSQLGVVLTYANGESWTWVDGGLFLPQEWFGAGMVRLRQKVGLPAECHFLTKVELGWWLIQRAMANGLLFEAVGCDDNYGRSHWFRSALDAAGVQYMAEVPSDFQVYLEQPKVEVPVAKAGRGGKPRKKRIVGQAKPLTVRQVADQPDTPFYRLTVRPTERGHLVADFAVRPVWTRRDGLPMTQEVLLIRRDLDGDKSYALSNAPAETPLSRLAWQRCQRHFVERSIQDAKTEFGWDELAAHKYLAWQHHLALTVLASWFIAETKLDWQQKYQRHPQLAGQLAVDFLPRLSTANVRAMLRAVMPLRQFSPEEAIQQVVNHLLNRTRARRSRLKSEHHARASPSLQ